jgi:GrpB-like predicted nucleotidyltransferase (UPF0157 family)
MVRLVPFDPGWAAIYAAAAVEIREALGPAALGVDHVGSTAIPALMAKPVVDMLILVDHHDPEETYRSPLMSLGYVFDHRDEGHVFFTGTRAGTAIHIHVVESRAIDAGAMVTFRDYLRSHPDEARRYEVLKRDLAATFTDGNAYADAKTPYVRSIVREAEREASMGDRPKRT